MLDMKILLYSPCQLSKETVNNTICKWTIARFEQETYLKYI